MQPWETRQVRQLKRRARRADVGSLEQLEARELLAFSPLGFSLPDLTITGQAGPRAAWGGVLNVSVILQNIGASTITEPLSQLPSTAAPTAGSPYGSTSTADVPDTTIDVFVSKSARSARGAVKVGDDPSAANLAEQRGTARQLVHAAGPPQGLSGRRRQVLCLVRR